MVTGELRNKVDQIWQTIWTGGITSPITVLEQITCLMFMKLLDDNQLKVEAYARAHLRFSQCSPRRRPNCGILFAVEGEVDCEYRSYWLPVGR